LLENGLCGFVDNNALYTYQSTRKFAEEASLRYFAVRKLAGLVKQEAILLLSGVQHVTKQCYQGAYM
jgi:hypothetical protein